LLQISHCSSWASPRSGVSGGGSLGVDFCGTALDLYGTKTIDNAGEFILEVHADRGWSVLLQF